MKIIGITGGVGAGKSSILNYLRDKYNAYILLTDIVGAKLMTPRGEAYKQIVDTFGTGILKENKEINKEKLASIVFNNKDEIKKLNNIVHPLVKRCILDMIELLKELDNTNLVVIESALLLEDNYNEICTETWYIYADEETRIKRLRESRGYSEARSRSIMNNQKTDAEFRVKCDKTIDNSGSQADTLKQIDKILGKEE